MKLCCLLQFIVFSDPLPCESDPNHSSARSFRFLLLLQLTQQGRTGIELPGQKTRSSDSDGCNELYHHHGYDDSGYDFDYPERNSTQERDASLDVGLNLKKDLMTAEENPEPAAESQRHRNECKPVEYQTE